MRQPMMDQKLIVQDEFSASSSEFSSVLGSDGDEKWLQHLYAHLYLGLPIRGSLREKVYLDDPPAEPTPICQNFPCSQQAKTGKQKHPQKKKAEFIGSEFSSVLGSDGDDKWLQHLYGHLYLGLPIRGSLREKLNLDGPFMEPTPIFQNFPCRQQAKRGKQKHRQKKTAEFTGDQSECNMQKHPVGAFQNKHIKKKRRSRAELLKKYALHLRAHGQRNNLIHGNNSINQQGMLNSEMFELYFENIWSWISEEKRNSFAYLDCLWFNLCTKSRYEKRVLNWIKRKNIFAKKYVLVPIVMWSHWSLLILCHFGEESNSDSCCMVLLDSLQSANQNLEPRIRKFVSNIHKVEGRPANRASIRKIPLLIPKVPQQRNGEECGCYVLFYVNLFLENAPESFSISNGYPYFMNEDWFTPESLENFREQLNTIQETGFSSVE